MSNISITYNTSTESNVIKEFSTFEELKSFIKNNRTSFIGAMKAVCDNNTINCNGMFGNCTKITSLDLSEFNTSNVTDMNGMFYRCESLTSLDLSNFNTENVTDMQQMFYYCQNLISLDLSSFNTSKVTDMSYMFGNCESLTSLNLSSFDTSKVTEMDSMFYYCKSLTSLNLSSFDTNKVTYMDGMFYYCKSLTSLNLSSFDTNKVTYMDGMFYYCRNLTTIYCEQDWGNKTVTYSSDMFTDCIKLKGAISYDLTKVDINYANPDTGYFTYFLLGGPSRKFLVNLNMDQNEIKNMLLDKRNTTNSLNPVAGQIYYNITDKKTYLYNGTEWEEIFSYKEDFSLTEAQAYEPIS